MTEGVRPVSGVAATDRRVTERRSGERRHQETPPSRALVPTSGPASAPHDDPAEPADRPAPTPDTPAAPAAAFAAQLIGQGGQRTGIRGGPPILDAARSTYLGAEYSGEHDRRPPPGKVGKTEV